MKWTLKKVIKETDHRFLNFYTLEYEVEEEKGKKEYTYFLASRNEDSSSLKAVKEDYSRPDAVLIGAYLFQEGKIHLLLEKQFRPGLNRFVYSFPAGLMDKEDKDIEETARRELKEETGYSCKNIQLLVPPSPTSEGLSDECNAVVKAELVQKGKENKEEFEDIQARLYSEEEVRALLKDEKNLFSNPARLLILLLLEQYGTKA